MLNVYRIQVAVERIAMLLYEVEADIQGPLPGRPSWTGLGALSQAVFRREAEIAVLRRSWQAMAAAERAMIESVRSKVAHESLHSQDAAVEWAAETAPAELDFQLRKAWLEQFEVTPAGKCDACGGNRYRTGSRPAACENCNYQGGCHAQV